MIVEVDADPTSVIVYGVIADLIVIVPIVFYFSLDNTNGFAEHHKLMILILAITWMPYGIVWFLALSSNSPESRIAL